MNNEKEIGLIVRKLRGDMSLRTFASLCNISHTTLDNIEKGVDFRTKKATNPSVYTLQKIAKAANVPLSYITGEDKIQNSPELPELSEGEKAIVDLFRLIPKEQQKHFLEMGRVFADSLKKD